MPKKASKVKDGTRLLRNKGDGALYCDLPDRMPVVINPGGTIQVSLEIADCYLNGGTNNWEDVTEEGGE